MLRLKIICVLGPEFMPEAPIAVFATLRKVLCYDKTMNI